MPKNINIPSEIHDLQKHEERIISEKVLALWNQVEYLQSVVDRLKTDFKEHDTSFELELLEATKKAATKKAAELDIEDYLESKTRVCLYQLAVNQRFL